MKDSNLTPNEMKEFAGWLENRQRSLEAEQDFDIEEKLDMFTC